MTQESSPFPRRGIRRLGVGHIGPEILLLHDFGVSLHHDLTVFADIFQVDTNGRTFTECFDCRVYEHVHSKVSAACLSTSSR